MPSFPPGPGSPGQRPDITCEHGPGCHSGAEPAVGTAPADARGWLLIEHNGPWPPQALDAELPGALGKLAVRAAELGLRVQLIRRPGRRSGPAGTLFTGWAAGPAPWLRRLDGPSGELLDQLPGLAGGTEPSVGEPVADPVYLVCTHAKRDACCARLGTPLARALSAAHPAQVWETSHLGGHRYAANLLILPHGLYYGQVDEPAAAAAIGAYQRGEIVPRHFRGRAGQSWEEQQDRYQRMVAAAQFGLAGLG